MKCPKCGARVKKGEEICPECSAFTGRALKPEPPVIQPEEIDYEILEAAEAGAKAADAPSSEKYFYKDYLLLPTLIKGGTGLAMLVFVICYMVTSPRFLLLSSSQITAVFAFLFAGFSLFSAIASVIQERSCYLDITDGKVSGVIPNGTFDTRFFEIELADIVSVEKTDFNSRGTNPKVIIITDEEKVVIRGSSKIMLSDFSDNLKKQIEK